MYVRAATWWPLTSRSTSRCEQRPARIRVFPAPGPALTQTLNYLSHMGTPLALVAADPLKSDLYYRYNQSLQEFVNASHAFHTVYSSAR